MDTKRLLKAPYPLVFIWAILTALMLICSANFGINDYVANPQHGIFDNFENVNDYIAKSGKMGWFKAFFIVDFFWALSFLLLMRDLVKRMIDRLNQKGGTISDLWLKIFTISAILAYGADVVEGYAYLTQKGQLAKIAYSLKILFYGLTVLQFIFWVLRSYVFAGFSYVLRFIRTSILSLVFIGLIYVLLTAMPQGGTIIVDLFENPWGIVLMFIFLTFLAILLSHFPTYVDIWLNDDDREIELIMSERAVTFMGMGLIYYSTKGRKIKAGKQKFLDRVVSILRRSLGILLFIAVFNIVFSVAERFYGLYFDSMQLTGFVTFIAFLVYTTEINKYYARKDVLYNRNATPQEVDTVVSSIIKYVRFFPKFLLICTSLAVFTAIVAGFKGWSRIAVLLFIFTLGLSSHLYVYFKLSRTFFKYVYYSDALYNFNPDMFNQLLLSRFKNHPDRQGLGETKLQTFFGKFSDNVRYLALMRVIGISSTVILIGANFSFWLASVLNPLIVIMLYIIIFYSVIIIAFKHILYYTRNENSNPRFRSFYRYGLPTLVLVVFGYMQWAKSQPNALHKLTQVERTEQFLPAETYFKDRTRNIAPGSKENFFFVGSYGGGLKANLWNLLLLNELDKRSGSEFTERTMVMSGVSGGAVGIANYTSILNEKGNNADQKSHAIFKIGSSNVLSNELVYLLGKDLVREYIPNKNAKDRSYKSMKDHAKHTGMGDRYNTLSYSDYWLELYNKRKGNYPLLVMNTTSTLGRQGVATTVDFAQGTFPAADYLSSLGDSKSRKDLTYFGAVSTTNRFPLFSPSAEIEGKGTYVDGGYFENSGMLSALEIYETYAQTRAAGQNKIQPVFINIINSKDYYIAHKVIEDWGFKKVNQDRTSEIPAILSTVVSIDKLPRYVFEKIKKKNYVLETIMMPHMITYNDVKTVLRGDVDEPIELMKRIEAHNKKIKAVLQQYKPYKYKRWGVVEPPLARLLSEPAVRYQEAMVFHHPEVQQAFKTIKFYLESQDILDYEIQREYKRTFTYDTITSSPSRIKTKK